MKINTPIFNDQQKRFALILLSLFHIFIITASNYFVQIPFEINLKLTALGFADDFYRDAPCAYRELHCFRCFF